MLNIEQIVDWRGQDVFDSDGERLGKLDEVYYDRDSGEPVIASIKSGLLGRHSALVPLVGATAGRDYVRVAFATEKVKSTEDLEIALTLSADTLAQVRTIYGVPLDDGGQLEAATLLEQRRAEAQEAIERADALEREAIRSAEGAKEARGQADEATGAADAAERDAVSRQDEAAAAREAEAAARQNAGPPLSSDA